MLEIRRRTLEFGIYRDGDNNLDSSQAAVIGQARETSARNGAIEFTVENTSRGFGTARTTRFTIEDGADSTAAETRAPDDMAAPSNLARFVVRTLDNAERCGAKQTWIELVDHGAGDGGGLEADSFKRIMPMPKIAQAIADGMKLHARSHPEDANRNVDGVVANQCLMASLGFVDALSHAGVRWLAASPETMVSPGVPSNVADAIARNEDNPSVMAAAIVRDVMSKTYGSGGFQWKPAAAFDVLDLAADKRRDVENAVRTFNETLASRAGNDGELSVLRTDARSVEGMARFPDATADMPWRVDRPAIALYHEFATDGRLDPQLRAAAKNAERAVRSIVVSHAESESFEPFGGADYRDAVGPTVHFPTSRAAIDPWAPRITETRNRFFNETASAQAEAVIA